MADARSDLKERLKKLEFRNWVALVLMLDVAKVALQEFSKSVIDDFLQDIKRKSGPLCGKCTFQTTKQQCNNPDTCPGTKLRAAMTSAHRFGKPTFQDTNMQDCLDDHWAVAKCYITEESHAKTLVTTDFSAVIKLAINNTLFPHRIDDGERPDSTNNVFFKARNVRNLVMHASPLEISGSCLNDNMRVLVKMLKSFRPMPASDAIDDIEKLEHDVISKQKAVDACQHRLRAIREFEQEFKGTITKIFKELISKYKTARE